MFTRVVTRKNNRQYLYLEERYREGGKVRSRSRSLGPINRPSNGGLSGWLKLQMGETHGVDWDAIEREMLNKQIQEQAKLDKFAEEMHAAYGMRMDTPTGPVEKVTAPAAPDVPDIQNPDAMEGQ